MFLKKRCALLCLKRGLFGWLFFSFRLESGFECAAGPSSDAETKGNSRLNSHSRRQIDPTTITLKVGDRLLLLSQWFQPLAYSPRRTKTLLLKTEFL